MPGKLLNIDTHFSSEWQPQLPRYQLMSADGSNGKHLCWDITITGNAISINNYLNGNLVHVEPAVVGKSLLIAGANGKNRYVSGTTFNINNLYIYAFMNIHVHVHQYFFI